MREIHRAAIVLAAGLGLAATSAGCAGNPRRSLASTEPALTHSESSGGLVIDGDVPSRVAVGPSATPSIVDRHPLLSRPRHYYESSGNNKVVKTAAAAVVGVPAGIVGELRQIVVGAPPAPTVPVVTSPAY